MRSSPLKAYRFQIGLVAVVALVALRLALGCHFLYEGSWKIENAATFSAEPFLSEAKGPFAPAFYAMLYDLDGRKRLAVEEVADEKGGNKEVVSGNLFSADWSVYHKRFVRKYRLSDEQIEQAQAITDNYRKALNEYLADHCDEIKGYLGALDRFQETLAKGNNGAEFQKQRLWEERHKLRAELKRHLGAIDAIGAECKSALWNTLTEEQQARGPVTKSWWNPFRWTRIEQINFAVTFALTGIGLCLLLGLLARPAALGGAVFMFFVLLTQPPWPTIYPPASPESGHALLVDKNFIEMLALLVMAALPVGRWAGLDFFLHHYVCRRFCCFKCKAAPAAAPTPSPAPQTS